MLVGLCCSILGLFLNLRNRERMAVEHNEALQDEVHMLRELAAKLALTSMYILCMYNRSLLSVY